MKQPADFLRWKNCARIMGLLLLAAGLQACGAIKLAYNQAPEAAYWYFNDYVDFTQTQRPAVKDALLQVHQWHRQTQLPLYIGTLQKLQGQLDQDVAATQACEVYADVRGKLLTLSGQVAPGAARIAASLDDSQFAELQRKFDKVNEKFRDDFMEGSAASLRKKRLNNAVKRAEMLYGKLAEPQRAVLQARLENSPFNAQTTYAERLRRQRDAVETLRALRGQQEGGPKAESAMRSLIGRNFTSPDPAYRSYAGTLQQDACATFAALHNSTTVAQRAKAVETLRQYEQDLRILGAQS